MDGQYDVDKNICDKSYDYWKIVSGLRKVESLKDRGKRVVKPIFKFTNSLETKKRSAPTTGPKQSKKQLQQFLCSFSTVFSY